MNYPGPDIQYFGRTYISILLCVGSQVCGILWNEEYKEIVTGHGFSHNQLTVWKYPAMTKGNIKDYKFK